MRAHSHFESNTLNSSKSIRVSLSSINSEDKRYQNRKLEVLSYGDKGNQEKQSSDQIKSIQKQLQVNPRAIEKIEVVEEASIKGKYIIFSGFHRFGAYARENKRTNGKSFKQIRVNVISKEEAQERYLKLNSEHKGLVLLPAHKDEQKWQIFLQDEVQLLSKKQQAETVNVTESTIGNWRRELKEYEGAGFFDVGYSINRDSITGKPHLKACRDALRTYDDEQASLNSKNPLSDADKERLKSILHKGMRSKEPDKLLHFINHYWGEPVSRVNFDALPDDL